jgi:hypothetical protein
MGERNSGDQGSLGRDERLCGDRRPQERLGVPTKEVCERLQRLRHGGQESPIKIDET